jgi:hypothetical protein
MKKLREAPSAAKAQVPTASAAAARRRDFDCIDAFYTK